MFVRGHTQLYMYIKYQLKLTCSDLDGVWGKSVLDVSDECFLLFITLKYAVIQHFRVSGRN